MFLGKICGPEKYTFPGVRNRVADDSIDNTGLM